MKRSAASVIAALLLGAALAALEPGDPGLVHQPERCIPDYPAMPRWAVAGVTGGIPPAGEPRIVVAPGDDLAAALRAGGVIGLAAGVHRLTAPVHLPAGTVVQGAGADASIIDLAGGGALVVEGVTGVGLRRLRLTDGVVARELAERPVRVAILEDRPLDGVPRDHAAVRFHRVSGCWIEDCAFIALPDAPLRIVDADRLTIRRVRMAGALHRGTGHGILLLDGVRDSLLHRLDLDGLRQLRLTGETVGNVIAGSAFAVPILLTDSAAVRDNLFEANLHALPPGLPWSAFAWSRDAIGPGNLVVDSRVYAGGTDAIVPGQLPPPGGVLALATHPQRGTWDDEKAQWRNAPAFAPATRAVASASVAPAVAMPSIAPPADAPADAGPILALAPTTVLTDALVAQGPLDAAWDAAPAVGWPRGNAPALDGVLAPAPATAWRDGALDVLAIAGADGRLVWAGCVLEVTRTTTVVPAINAAGETVCFLSGQRLEPGAPIALAAGRHPLWLVARARRPNPFTKRLPVRLSFTSVASAAPPAQREPIADPPGGTLFAANAAIDRQEIAAWPAILRVHRLLAEAEPVGLDAALADLAADQGERIGGRLARAWLAIVQRVEADHRDEADEILRWRRRSTAYFLAGLPQRAWAFERHVAARWPGAPEARPERIIP